MGIQSPRTSKTSEREEENIIEQQDRLLTPKVKTTSASFYKYRAPPPQAERAWPKVTVKEARSRT